MGSSYSSTVKVGRSALIGALLASIGNFRPAIEIGEPTVLSRLRSSSSSSALLSRHD